MSTFWRALGIVLVWSFGAGSQAFAVTPVAQVRCARPAILSQCASLLRAGKPVSPTVTVFQAEDGDVLQPLAGKSVNVHYLRVACGDEWVTAPKVLHCVPNNAPGWTGRVNLIPSSGTTTRGDASDSPWHRPEVLWPPDRTGWLHGAPVQVYVPTAMLGAGRMVRVTSEDSDFTLELAVAKAGWLGLPNLPVGERLHWRLEQSGKSVAPARTLRIVNAEQSGQLRKAVHDYAQARGWQGAKAVLAWLADDAVGVQTDFAAVALADLSALAPKANSTELGIIHALAGEVLAPTRLAAGPAMELTIDDGHEPRQRFSWADAVAERAVSRAYPKGTRLGFGLHEVDESFAAGISFWVGGKPVAITPGHYVTVVPADHQNFRRSGEIWEVDGTKVKVCWTLGAELRNPVTPEQPNPGPTQVRGCLQLP